MVSDNYDLYAYNEGGDSNGYEWINYKSSSFSLASGNGYLYAHLPASTLRLAGTLNNGNFAPTIELDYANSNLDIKGFNLLGNPTAHNISFTKTGSVSDGYYYLNNDEAWDYTTATTVPVGCGFMVKANAVSQSVTLNPQSKESESTKEDQYLSVGVGEAKTYVKLNEGVSMPLLDLRGEHAGLYLTRDKHSYVMLVRDGADAMGLCFEARDNGVHTLTVDLQGHALDYLHLIDHKTGADIDLLQTPEYTFEAKTTDYASRFKLVFAPANEDADDDNEPFAYFDGSEWRIQNKGIATLQLMDMTGRVIREETIDGNAKLSAINYTSGVYMLRLVSNDAVNTQKIVIR